MWKQRRRSRKVKFPASRTANLCNLRVIETNSPDKLPDNSLKSLKEVPLNDFPGGHSLELPASASKQKQFARPSVHPFKTQIVSKKQSKSSAFSSKLKQKYFHKRGRYNQCLPFTPSKKKSCELLGGNVGTSFQESSKPIDSQKFPKLLKMDTNETNHEHSSDLQLKDQKSDQVSPSSKKSKPLTDKVQNPETGDDCFEEVEVASYENEDLEVPVRFRKTKVKYLKYKKLSFFKPKIYNISKNCITVNCSSSIKNADASVIKNDLVTSDKQNIEVLDIVDNESDKTEVSNDDVQFISQDDVETEKVKDNAVTEITANSAQNEVVDGFIKSVPIGSKVQTNATNLNSDQSNTKGSLPDKIDESAKKSSNQVGNVIEVILLDDSNDAQTADTSLENVKTLIEKYKEFPLTESRDYNKLASDNLNTFQGKSLIQKSLDSWKSHLIGMEYLIEVQDKVKEEVLSHHCVLCNEDLPFGQFKSIVVLNHINSYNHIVNYMEKLFSTYSFRECKGFDNIVTLQKVCEELNRNHGYYSMCITALDQYVLCKETLEKSLLDVGNLYGKPVDIQKTFESVFDGEIRNVMKVILNKVSEREHIACEKRRLKQLMLAKRSTPLSSFLQLKLASSDFRKPFKSTKPKTTAPKLNVPSKDVTNSAVNSDSHSKKAPVVKLTTAQATIRNEREDSNSDIEILPTPTLESLPGSESSQKGSLQQKGEVKGQEKPALQPGLHSKRCRSKRILSKENPRLTAKTSLNNELAKDVSSNLISKHNRVVNTSSASASKLVSGNKTFKQNARRVKAVSSSHNVTLRKTNADKETKPLDSSQATDIYRKVNIKVRNVPSMNKASETPRKISTRSDSSPKERSTSPYKRIVTRVSKSPTRRVITNPLRLGPVRRIKSPLRISPTRRISSPIRISPERRHSRSPGRRIRRPISPLNRFSRRQSRSPGRRHSRSPVRRQSRSPARRHSRSPVRNHSRSPARRHSRSPGRRHSRSPARRQSRSPGRRQSRSPGRRRSRSPIRRHQRSPVRRYVKSPVQRYSRSPLRRYSRSPLRRRSRSYERKFSRSPINRRSRSPFKRLSRSPERPRSPRGRHSVSPSNRHTLSSGKYKNTFRAVSPSYDRRVRDSSKDSFDNYSRSNSPQLSHRYDSLKRQISTGRSRSPSSISGNLIPFLNELTNQEIELDPVSDEDESKYFGTADDFLSSDSKLSAQKKVFAEMLKKFSAGDKNPNDTAVNKFMQFMQAHSSEIQEFIGSKSSKMPASNAPSNVQEQNAFLQQYLLHNLAGKRDMLQSNAPFAPQPSNAMTAFGQQSFNLNHPSAKYGPSHMIPGLDHVDCSMNQANIFPPNLNMPPPNPFSPVNQRPMNPIIPPPKPRVPAEAMFKDLKATVTKLFGANSNPRLPEVKPGFRPDQEPAKFDRNIPDVSKFVSPGQKILFNPNFINPPVPAIRHEVPQQFERSQFFGGRGNAEQARGSSAQVPPPTAKVSFCEPPSPLGRGPLFPVVNRAQSASVMSSRSSHSSVNEAKVSLAQRLASVLVQVGMVDVPAPLLQEMLMKIGAFSSSPPQDITEAEIVSILKRLGYL